MAVSGALAKQYVEFATKGLDGVTKDMERIKKGLDQIEAIGNKAKKMFLGITGTIGGFVTAGLMGTTQANRMQIQMQLLSREIAGIFAPLIEKVIVHLQRLVNWFQGLSGKQQENIRNWVLVAAAITGLLAIIPKLISGFMAIRTAIYAIGVALGVSSGGLLFLVGALVTAFIAFGGTGETITNVVNDMAGAFTELAKAIAAADFSSMLDKAQAKADFLKAGLPEWMGGGKAYAAEYIKNRGMPNMAPAKEDAKRTAVTPAGGNFEAVQETFRRIQQSVVKQSGGSPQDKANGYLGEITAKVKDLVNMIPAAAQKLANAQPLGQ